MPRDGLSAEIGTDWVSRLARLQPWYLLVRFPHRLARSVFAFASVTVAIGIISTLAICTRQPLVFPSLGATAFLLFSQPSAAASSPRNVTLSHGSAIIIGWGSYWLSGCFFGFDSPTTQAVAAAVSLGAVSAWMIAANIPHPPAAATALIVSLGLIVQWEQLIAVMAGVVMLTAQSYAINRTSGIACPLWGACSEQQGDDLTVTALRTKSSGPKGDVYTEIADRIAARQTPPRPGGRT